MPGLLGPEEPWRGVVPVVPVVDRESKQRPQADKSDHQGQFRSRIKNDWPTRTETRAPAL